jgi:hypothetical protein
MKKRGELLRFFGLVVGVAGSALACSEGPRGSAGPSLTGAPLPSGSAPSKIVPSKIVPWMTIQIFNDSSEYNIYPVLSTGTATQDAWLQAWFDVPKSQYPKNPYPKTAKQFRIYVNPVKGIPPGGSATIQLPLYSQLEATPDPTKEEQYIDWWGGGRVEIFDGLKSAGKAPEALTANYTRNRAAPTKQPIAGSPTPTVACAPAACDPLYVLSDPAGLKDNEPSQLTEYTLGALKLNKDPVELVTNNIDIDVSYVDTAYLPAAMEPYGNPDVGYVGTTMLIPKFRSTIDAFFSSTDPKLQGWPKFVDNQKNLLAKVPSTMRLMASLTGPAPSPDLQPPLASLTGPAPSPAPPLPVWAPIKQLIDAWNACQVVSAPTSICADMRDIRAMFQTNYDTYKKGSKSSSTCDQSRSPIDLTDAQMIMHVYGWTPFTEYCAVDFNLLEKTPGYTDKYQKLKGKYDVLQLGGTFNPYTTLIHGSAWLNIANAYAYSVDDAVGNLQASGAGFIIAVGGPRGLPNPNKAQDPINVSIGYGAKDRVRFEKYGVFCGSDPSKDDPRTPIDPDYAAFPLYPTGYPTCRIVLRDNGGTLYKTALKTGPAYPPTPPADQPIPPANKAPVDCSLNKGSQSINWCQNNFVYTEKGAKKDNHYFVLSAPPQPPPSSDGG